MSRWEHHDLVLLPLPGADEPVGQPAVAEHLASRRVCAAVLDSERIGVVGGVLVRLGTDDMRVAVTDPDHTVHPGPHLFEVLLGLAYRVGAAVHVDEDLVVDHSGRVLDDARVLAGVETSDRVRSVTAWRDDDLLTASMLAGELGGHGDAVLADGWVVTAWEDDVPVPATTLPLPGRHHPVVLATRSGDLRSVLLRVTPEADLLQVTWAPRLARVLDVTPGSPADLLLEELQVTAATEHPEDPDDWPDAVAPWIRPALVAAQRGPGDMFLEEVARQLWLPVEVARLAETLEPGAGACGTTRVGGASALRVGWDHVRTPAPETDAERRLREMPRWRVAVQVVRSLLVAATCVGIVLVADFRFVPEWLFWGMAVFAAFNAGATLWLRRSVGPG